MYDVAAVLTALETEPVSRIPVGFVPRVVAATQTLPLFRLAKFGQPVLTSNDPLFPVAAPTLGHHHENPATSATVLQPNVLGIYRLLKYGVQKRLSQWATFRSAHQLS